MWNELNVKMLREIAKSYKSLHTLGNISKQKKAVLLETLKGVMEWRNDTLYTKAEHGNKKVFEDKKETPKAKEPTPKAKEPTPKDEKFAIAYQTSKGEAYVIYESTLKEPDFKNEFYEAVESTTTTKSSKTRLKNKINKVTISKLVSLINFYFSLGMGGADRKADASGINKILKQFSKKLSPAELKEQRKNIIQ